MSKKINESYSKEVDTQSIDTQSESNIDTVAEELFSSQKVAC